MEFLELVILTNVYWLLILMELLRFRVFKWRVYDNVKVRSTH